MLYFRMILNMVVSIYTGRVVLQVLGVDDFGIYNIVGGVVVLFSFINNFLNTACERFISVAIVGTDKTAPFKVFRTALFLHVIIALIFVLASETIGLWFVYNKLVIPAERLTAALWLYHICVLNTFLTIIKVPYNATIIAEEKMDFYAYTSIGETIFRLLIVYLLTIIAFDKLIVYGLLHTLIALGMLLWYQVYSRKNFYYSAFSLRYDSEYIKKMTSFSGWNLFGSIADLGYKQGTSIILNLFCGVALNAAMGLANTVRSTIFNFVSNFQVASNPQILKQFALAEYSSYSNLVYRISKFSYILMLFLALPAMINMDFILNLWLDEVPAYTTSFVTWGLLYCLIDCLHGPLWTSMMATGKIRNYQVLVSCILLLNLPFSYIALDLGYPPESIFIIQIIISAITILVRIFFSARYAHLTLSAYIRSVLLPLLFVTVLSCPLPYFVSTLYVDSFIKLLVTGLISVLSVSIISYLIGLTKSERQLINSILIKKFTLRK